MSLFVKICGITSEAAVEAAISAGADAVGFVFHAASPRCVSPERAAGLAAAVGRGVLKVAVTLHPSQQLVDEVLRRFVPDVWQTDAGDFATIELPAGIARWPVLRAGAPLPEPLPGRLLFEGPKSGSGQVADWAQARALAARAELILGGGLTAANVGGAIRQVRPFGVDTSSGVEFAPGLKDPARVREFVAAARAAAAGAGG
jgi:phosphoribosylanthranilate isomerase